MDFLGTQISNAIWDAMLKWFYEIIYGAIADFFEMMGNMGADVFDLEWVKATVKLFTLFGWGLFVAGTVVAIFDVAIEYQCGRANVKTTALNIIKGFFACSLIGVVPIELYKFCISLQNTFSHDLTEFLQEHSRWILQDKAPRCYRARLWWRPLRNTSSLICLR